MKTHKDYQNAIEKFCEDNKDSTIYLAGEISHPGISDLDFLIVENSPKIDKTVEPFLMGGNVLIMPEFAIEKINILESMNLKLLQGKKHDLVPAPKQLSTIEIIEWLPERILKCKSFKKTAASRSDVLMLHKSINRSIKKVQDLLAKKYDIIEADVARSSISLKNTKILDVSIDQGLKAWKEFCEFLSQTSIRGQATGSVEICDYYAFRNTFNHLMLYFDHLSRIDCSLSSVLRKRMSIYSKDLFLDEELSDFINARWQLMDSIYLWFKEKGLSRGMIKYGWLLN